MEVELDLEGWIEEFKKGSFDASDRETQIKAGWYDWFCSDYFLQMKTKAMGGIIEQIVNGGKVDLTTTYVFFKNNCPLAGPLYDDFRICDIKTGEVLLTTQIDCFREKHKYVVYGRFNAEDNFSTKPIFETNSQEELVKWFNTPKISG